MDINAVIDRINTKSQATIFHVDEVVGLKEFLLSLGQINYIGHGAQTMCFAKDSVVIKCCRKRKGSITISKDNFLSNVNRLKEHEMPILYPLDVIYENHNWLVYTQPLCTKILSLTEISPKVCYDILNFVALMIKTNVRISDIYFLNFGLYKQKLSLFDFHEIDDFTTASNFMISNLYSTFVFLGKNLRWNGVPDLGSVHIKIGAIIDENFGEKYFPKPYYKFLESLYEKDVPRAALYLEKILKELRKLILKKFNKYQHVIIEESGQINLQSHTLTKYHLASDLIKNKGIMTILDARCCIGGVGLKIAQEFPNLKVMLSNEKNSELDTSRIIAQNSLIFNASFMHIPVKNILSFKPAKKYDLTLYYSYFHHLLKKYTINELLGMVRSQTAKYCIIEVPIMGDALLTKVTKGTHQKNNYQCLESPEVFRYHLAMNRFKVNRCIRINYDKDHLIRYAFICNV